MKSEVRAILFATMSAGLNKVTAKNIEEWIFRLDLLFDSGCAFLHDGRNNVRLTLDDLAPLVGLASNASTLSRSQFMTKIARIRLAAQRNRDAKAMAKLFKPEKAVANG